MTEKETYEKHGQTGDYFWVESAAIYLCDFLKECPEAVEGMYCVQTSLGSTFLVPDSSLSRQDYCWQRWHSEALLGIVASYKVLCDKPGSEFYIFEHSPDQRIFFDLPDDKLGMTIEGERENELRGLLVDRLNQLGAHSYLSNADCFRFFTKSKALVDKLLSGPTVAGLPFLEEDQEEAKRSGFCNILQEMVSKEPCATPDCGAFRIVNGIYYPKHHMEMMHRTRDVFDD